MTPERSRERFAAASHALLATADRSGAPHIVPIVFALAGDTIYNAVDRKPKRTTALRRLDNVRENPRAAVLAEHYDEDWTKLWWVRETGSIATGRMLRGCVPIPRTVPCTGTAGATDIGRLLARLTPGSDAASSG